MWEYNIMFSIVGLHLRKLFFELQDICMYLFLILVHTNRHHSHHVPTITVYIDDLCVYYMVYIPSFLLSDPFLSFNY